MDIKPIKTEKDYRSTLQEIESLMAAEADTPEGERLDVLIGRSLRAQALPSRFPRPGARE